MATNGKEPHPNPGVRLLCNALFFFMYLRGSPKGLPNKHLFVEK